MGLLLAVVGAVLQGAECLMYAILLPFLMAYLSFFISGIHCAPIDILGLGQNECQFEPVCCENDYFFSLLHLSAKEKDYLTRVYCLFSGGADCHRMRPYQH